MRTIETKLYKFDELSEEAQETAIEQVRDSYSMAKKLLKVKQMLKAAVLFDDVIQDAIDKFEEHISDCLASIEKNIDYMFSDEAIIEDIEANGLEFTEAGLLY
jgi:hypothetical protein